MRDFWNKLGNVFMLPLLRSPLHWLVSGQFMLISFTGRKTGRVYTTPVQFRRDGDLITIFTQRHRQWWKNLQGGARVSLVLKGRVVAGVASTETENLEQIKQQMHWMYPRAGDAQIDDLVGSSVMISVQVATA